MLKNHFLNHRLIYLVLFLISLWLLIFYLGQDKLTRSLSFWRVSIKLNNFSFVSKSSEKSVFSKIEQLEAKKDQTIVKLTKTEVEDHKKFIEDRKFLLDSLFLPTNSPYPEVITNTLECSNEFKPTVDTISDGVIYTLFAGERLNYGICSSDLIKYFSSYGIFDCKDKGVFEVRVYSKENGEPKTIIQSFRC